MPPKIAPGTGQLTRRSRNPSELKEPSPGPVTRPVVITRLDDTVRGRATSYSVDHGDHGDHDDLPATRRTAPPRDLSPEPGNPRPTALCTRLTRVLAVLTGLGAIGLQFHLYRAGRDTRPGPAAGSGSAPPSTARQPGPALDDRPLSTREMLESAARAEAGEIPPVMVRLHEDLFDQFRHSPDARDPRKLAAFMTLMARVMARHPATIHATLPVLLGVWRWNYGETVRLEDGREANVGALLTSSIVPPVVGELGGPRMPESQLGPLVLALCREPENIPPQLRDPEVLRAHARASASALAQVIRLTTAGAPDAPLAQQQQAEEARLRRCLKMVLAGPSFDERWIPWVVQSLQAQGPAAEPGLAIAPLQWARAIWQEFADHTLSNHPPSALPSPKLRTMAGLLRKVHEIETAEEIAVLASSGIPLPEHRRVSPATPPTGAAAQPVAKAPAQGTDAPGNRPSK